MKKKKIDLTVLAKGGHYFILHRYLGWVISKYLGNGGFLLAFSNIFIEEPQVMDIDYNIILRKEGKRADNIKQ